MTKDLTEGVIGSKTTEEIATEKWLTFMLEKQLYATSVINIEQIIRMTPITSVPHSPPYMRGIINLRGMVVPVLDLRILFGNMEAQDTDRSCIVIVNMDDSQVGFVVDDVDAVIDISNKSICPPPRLSEGGESKYLIGITSATAENTKGQNILMIDLMRVLGKDEFDMLSLGAHETET